MREPGPKETIELRHFITRSKHRWLAAAVARIDHITQAVAVRDTDIAAVLGRLAATTPEEQIKFMSAVAFLTKYVKEEIIEV